MQDPIGGHTTEALVRAKYGEKNYQDYRNECHRNARDGFLIELEKYGLGLRDLTPKVNFFSKVAVPRIYPPRAATKSTSGVR